MLTPNLGWGSYGKIWNLGHKAVENLLFHPHIVEEKIDGSQFSFGRFETEDGIELRLRSKGAIMNIEAPEKMFSFAAQTVKELGNNLTLGYTYRGEYLRSASHNTLQYDRFPLKHIILFDISYADGSRMNRSDLELEAERLGLEVVPLLFDSNKQGQVSYEDIRKLLDNTVSCLGGQKIEGVVIKPTIDLFGVDGKVLMGKFVSESFKESHSKVWAESNPQSGDILDQLIATYRTQPRWMKAIQHLRDDGKLLNAPQDIPKLMIELEKDLGQEEKDEIQKLLWKWAWPHISRGIKRGLPEFYKEQLLKLQFEQEGIVAQQ